MDKYLMITWIVLMVFFIILELSTVGLISIWFAAGAFVALLAALLGFGLPVQIILFLIVSILLLAGTRPWARNHLNNRTQKTNAATLIGKTIIVSEQVENLAQTGRGSISGMEWTLRSSDDDVIIPAGARARILEISGVKLIVEPEV